MSAIESAHVGGVGWMDQVACREDSLGRGPQRGVHPWAQSAAIKIEPPEPNEFMVRDPGPGEDHRVAVDDPASAGVDRLELDSLNRVATDDTHDPSPGRLRDAKAEPGQFPERRVRLASGLLRGHENGLATGLAQGEHRRPRHELSADDHSTGAG